MRRSVLRGRAAAAALGVIAGLSGQAQRAQGQAFAGINTADVHQGTAFGSARGASYSGPHSGNAPVLISGGNGETASNDFRGVVEDGGGDAFDNFGYLSVSGDSLTRSIVRTVTTLGSDGAYRWVDEITNNTSGYQFYTVRFGGDLGSNSATVVVSGGPGAGYRVTDDGSGGAGGDPPVGLVWGGNGLLVPAVATYTGAQGSSAEGIVLTYATPVLAPGQTITFVHFAFLGEPTADGQAFVGARAGALVAQDASLTVPELSGLTCQLRSLQNFAIPTFSAANAQADIRGAAEARVAHYSGPASGTFTDFRGAVEDGGYDPFDNSGRLTVSGTSPERSIERDVRSFFLGCESAYRWCDTITNTSGTPQTFSVAFTTILGSDAATAELHRRATQRTTFENVFFHDPPVTLVWGGNQLAADAALTTPVIDQAVLTFTLSLEPGESKSLVHFTILGAPGMANSATGGAYSDQRGQQLVAAAWDDPLFAGVDCPNVVNWPAPAPEDCPGDVNGDAVVNATDLFVYLDIWFADNGTSCPGPPPPPDGCPADVNGDSVVNATDIFVYLDLWFAQNGMGCP